ncbi:MAG TPA: hypothetical protein VFS60_19965, partial [Thermoanaerobaculia bacterium]|nr:hypothetical protein [Thermoanaerobaculia bacterium]
EGFTWNELIHTSYFTHKDVQRLIADHIGGRGMRTGNGAGGDVLVEWLHRGAQPSRNVATPRRQGTAALEILQSLVAGLAVSLLALAATRAVAIGVTTRTPGYQVDRIVESAFASDLLNVHGSGAAGDLLGRLVALDRPQEALALYAQLRDRSAAGMATLKLARSLGRRGGLEPMMYLGEGSVSHGGEELRAGAMTEYLMGAADSGQWPHGAPIVGLAIIATEHVTGIAREQLLIDQVAALVKLGRPVLGRGQAAKIHGPLSGGCFGSEKSGAAVLVGGDPDRVDKMARLCEDGSGAWWRGVAKAVLAAGDREHAGLAARNADASPRSPEGRAALELAELLFATDNRERARRRAAALVKAEQTGLDELADLADLLKRHHEDGLAAEASAAGEARLWLVAADRSLLGADAFVAAAAGLTTFELAAGRQDTARQLAQDLAMLLAKERPQSTHGRVAAWLAILKSLREADAEIPLWLGERALGAVEAEARELPARGGGQVAAALQEIARAVAEPAPDLAARALEGATEATRQIDEYQSRSRYYAEIASEWVRLGDLEAARSVAGRAPVPQEILAGYSTVLDALVSSPDATASAPGGATSSSIIDLAASWERKNVEQEERDRVMEILSVAQRQGSPPPPLPLDGAGIRQFCEWAVPLVPSSAEPTQAP